MTERKRLALGALLGLSTFTALVIGSASCLVDRKTEDFACTSQADCAADRLCTGGFCVSASPDAPLPPDAPACPGSCDTCNLVLKTCTVSCDSANACALVTCPPGFTCDISCSTANACGNIDCTDATACTVDCDGNNTCGNVTCGNGPCDVTCRGNDGCGVVNCKDSCDCNVDCRNGADCGLAVCPDPTSGPGDCTDGTMAGCASTAPNCKRMCP